MSSFLDYLNKERPLIPNMELHLKLEKHFVDVNQKLPYPPVAISIGTHTLRNNTYPTIFGTYGNFSAIVGASKSKKTFFKSLILASYLMKDENPYTSTIKGHKLSNDRFVVDIDTEQSVWHSQNVFKRVAEMSKNIEFYKPYSLRSLPHKERLQLIEYLIYESEIRDNISVMAIDGIADLIQDFNNLVECEAIVQKLMKWTAEKNIHITTIIHQNSTTNKATGHLGSFILKKAETVCNVVNTDGVVRVSFNQTRGYPIQDIEFSIDENGHPYVIGEQQAVTFEEKTTIAPNLNFETDPF